MKVEDQEHRVIKRKGGKGTRGAEGGERRLKGALRLDNQLIKITSLLALLSLFLIKTS